MLTLGMLEMLNDAYARKLELEDHHIASDASKISSSYSQDAMPFRIDKLPVFVNLISAGDDGRSGQVP